MTNREISTANLAEIDAQDHEEVWFVFIDFSDPVRLHTSVGDIEWGGYTWVGAGHLGMISELSESDLLSPAPLQLSLSGLNDYILARALDATEYGAQVIAYQGFMDDGTLVDDPIEQWSGTVEFASIVAGENSAITLTAQNDLADIDQADASRYSDEDQQSKYSGDVGCKYVTEMGKLRLQWAGGAVGLLSPQRGGGRKGNPRTRS